jgi:hypothetical protein
LRIREAEEVFWEGEWEADAEDWRDLTGESAFL